MSKTKSKVFYSPPFNYLPTKLDILLSSSLFITKSQTFDCKIDISMKLTLPFVWPLLLKIGVTKVVFNKKLILCCLPCFNPERKQLQELIGDLSFPCDNYMTNTSLAAPGALAHRLQRRTACNTSLPSKSNIADGVWK